MPRFSKDTMRATLCTIVFLYSLPWSLNGHLTTSHKNTVVPNTAENASGQREYTIDSGIDNVVSVSKSIQMLHLTSHSEQQGIRSKTPYADDEISNQRTSKNAENDQHNLTTLLAKAKTKLSQEVASTPQKEQRKMTENWYREKSTSPLQKVVTQHALAKRPNATNANVSPKEPRSMGPLDTFEATQVLVSSMQTRDFTSHSEQQGVHSRFTLNGEEETSYHSRNTHDDQGLTSMLAQSKNKILQNVPTTVQKEQKPTNSSHRPHTTFPLQIEMTTELNASTKAPYTTRTDVLPEEKTSRLKAIRVLVSRSKQTQQLTSHSDQRIVHARTLNGETPNRRTKRNEGDGEHKLGPTENHSTQRAQTTAQKEQGNMTEKSHIPDSTYLTRTENAAELTKTLYSRKVDTLRTSMGPLDTQEVIQVSQSRSVQTQDSTSQSKQPDLLQTFRNEDETSYQRTKRNVDDNQQNFTTLEQPKKHTTQEVTTTPPTEKLKPTESHHRLHKSSLQIENATEFNISTQPPIAKMTNFSQIGTTKRDHSGTQETTLETLSTTDLSGLYGVETTEMEVNKNNTYKDVYTSHTTMKTTKEPSPTTHAHTSAIIAATNVSGAASTVGVKTTGGKDTIKGTQGPEVKTQPVTKTKTSSTTKKTTPKQSTTPSIKKDSQKANPGPAVAGVIVTTFFLMFIAIIIILVRKRKMQKRQLENPVWAGPSPFLDGDVHPNLPTMDESEAINRQSFNQLSISNHLVFGRNTSEDVFMEDIPQGSTFGVQNPDETNASNGNSTAVQDPIQAEENKIQEGQAPVDSSSDTKTPSPETAQEPEIDSGESEQTDDLTPSSFKDIAIKPPPLVSIDLDSLSEEAAPFQTSDSVDSPAPSLP
ncbi:mucin-4 [Danio aesculapii]|uniref:mucin-4 n=1 Tax=Danio aesculapii TaxID=1142201 RepID=UPI0024BF8F28|nr:mucin-4 [Danio aesculapii]